jgi:hypothetical protein
MRYLTGALVLLLGAVAMADDVERIPLDRAQQFAKAFQEQVAKIDDLQIKPDVDTEKPSAFHAENKYGAMAVPDRNLTEDTFTKAGKNVTPIGHLWTRNLAPATDGTVTPNAKLRLVTVSVDGNEHNLPFFLLGLQKNPDGKLMLLVYGKEKEPIVKVPLQKADKAGEVPIELDGKKGENESGILILNLLGKYEARITVKEQEQ